MTEHELRIMLGTSYKGDAATKMISDLDKISSSGQKVSGVMKQVNKAIGGDIFANASDAFRKRNPHLFSGAPSGSIMQGEKFLAAGVKKLLGLGSLTGVGNPMMSNSFLAQGAQRAMGMGPLFPQGGPLGSILAQQGRSSAGGMAGIGSLGGSVAAGAVVLGLVVAFKALQKAVKGTMDAFEQARTLYAKALTGGGLGLQFTQRRASLANILGVGEKEVYQFGQAVMYLTPQIAWANNIIAKTTTTLTGVGWQFKILENDAHALFATIGAQAAPALISFSQSLAEIIKQMTDWVDKHQKYVQFVAELPNALAYAVGIGPDGKTIAQRENANSKNPVPQPLAFMKQIQASAWEHLGLVVGGIGGASPAQETARNTKQTADGVKQLVQATSRGGEKYNPFQGTQSYA